MTSFKVQAEDLTAHASHLDGLTDRFDTAIAAAESVSMSDEAYGLLCSFLPPIVNPVEEEGINALKAAKEGVSSTAENVRSTAKEYQETDDANSDELKKLDDAVKVNKSAVALRGVPAVADGGAQHEGIPVMESRHAAEQGTPAAEPQHQGTRPAEQGTPMTEPQKQAFSPQHQGATPTMRGDLQA
ncbi:type VII secretion target [Saccharopolyspora sp. ID03-671]|uniref:type VII secretion target n=1 Tax=Saccharopolyspora sp. ID03-671 TaxID=3073066 RepID=UPI0032546A31